MHAFHWTLNFGHWDFIGIWDLVIGIFTFTLFLFPFSTCSAADLRIIKTRHYEIHTDLDAQFAAELAQRMDVMYGQYEQRLSDFRPPKNNALFPAYLFTHERDYLAFTDNKAVHTGGLFVVEPQRSFLTAFLDGQGRDQMRRVLQHEAFHQFVYFTISKDMPIWLNEGLAQLFEEGIWTGQTFLLGQVPPRRIRQLEQDIKDNTLVDFKKFLAIAPEEWSANLTADAEKGATYYNQAWAMVHFLSESGHPDYEKRLMAFLKSLHNGAEANAAFRQSFPNVRAFQVQFSDWAATLKATSEATVLERQDTLGDLLVAISGDGHPPANMTQFRTDVITNGYFIKYTRGHVRWTTSKTPQVYFSNLSGLLYQPSELYFHPASGAPLPDIICRATGQLQLRTHFYKGDREIEHEVLIEPAGR